MCLVAVARHDLILLISSPGITNTTVTTCYTRLTNLYASKLATIYLAPNARVRVGVRVAVREWS